VGAEGGEEGGVGHEGVEGGGLVGWKGAVGEVGGEGLTVEVVEHLALFGEEGRGFGGRCGECSFGVEVPAVEAGEEGGGAELEGEDAAGAGHDLPEPGDHLILGLGHEEEGGCEAVAQGVYLRETGAEVGDAGEDVGVLGEVTGSGFAVVVAKAGVAVGSFRWDALGESEGEGFVAWVLEGEREGRGSCCVHVNIFGYLAGGVKGVYPRLRLSRLFLFGGGTGK